MALKLLQPAPDDDGRDEKKAELTEHLAELRTRLIRACVYALVGMAVMYFFYNPIYAALSAPLRGITDRGQGQPPTPNGLPTTGLAYNNFTEPFFLMLQIVMVGGLILAVPFIVMEMWGFIAPALTVKEKQSVLFVAPMSVILFVAGVSCAYLILPRAVRWFLSYLVPGAVLLQNPLTYIVFVVKMLLIFGLLFELPVVLMFLGKVGILSSALMKKHWRYAVPTIFTLAMVFAPSNDPGTMLALAVPMTLLYFFSIWLVKLVEPKEAAA